MRSLTVVLYAIFGASAVLAGLAVLASPSLVTDEAADSGLVAHLLREQAAGFVFIGLMFFWCMKHFEERRPVHFGFMVFTALFAAIHWLGYVQGAGGLASPVVNTIPFALLAATAPRPRRA